MGTVLLRPSLVEIARRTQAGPLVVVSVIALGTEIAAALRRPAHGQFEEGIAAQGVAVVGILISAPAAARRACSRRRPGAWHRR